MSLPREAVQYSEPSAGVLLRELLPAPSKTAAAQSPLPSALSSQPGTGL